MILKKGIQVKIISGKDKGKTGEILEINRKQNKVKYILIKIINGNSITVWPIAHFIPDLAPPFVPSIIFATSNGPGPNAPDNDIIITDIANSVKFNSKFNIT